VELARGERALTAGSMPEDQLAKRDIREGDTLTIKVRVTRVSDDGDLVTINCWGQRVSGNTDLIDFEKHEKGGAWPK
jgi:hypothetical protein